MDKSDSASSLSIPGTYEQTYRMSKKLKHIYTIGHSTLDIDIFIGRLKTRGVRLLADVRTVPRSRFNPQFNRDTLPGDLAGVEIEYEYFSALGGFRHSKLSNSPNTGWRSKTFRNYADYMMTGQFRAGLDLLIAAAMDKCTAIMCAEAVPWRCHRNLIADVLTIRGFRVMHIMSDKSLYEHSVTPWAHVSGMEITYPGLQA